MLTIPAAAKLSLYLHISLLITVYLMKINKSEDSSNDLHLPIFKLPSQASTEANCVRSGASGASGLQAWLAAIFLRVSGQQINLSKVFTMLEKLGLWARSFCQQSSISWWIASGQSMGAGRR